MMEQKELEKKEKHLKIVDKRRVGKSESVAIEEPNLKPSYVRQLEQKVERMEIALKQKMEELEDEAKKSRERILKDLEKRHEEKIEKIISDLFDLFDSIDKAIELSSQDLKTKEGLEIIRNSLEKFFEKHNVEQINPINEEFDPNVMEALQMAEGERNKVVSVLQKGYMRNGKVLKPAKVSVGNGENK
ncbi:MAG: nucleotide exchange factor GrpE [Acidobacteria bacterium]|nr:nucleotide exchange factor GrpE [Acidobacteriota bacterium]